jgi:hypothetical protein
VQKCSDIISRPLLFFFQTYSGLQRYMMACQSFM